MSILKLQLKNFKCFVSAEIALNNLTVFVGANAVGKSSILQSALLLLQGSNVADEKGVAQISLYRDFGYDMGVVENLQNFNTKDSLISIGCEERSLSIDMSLQPKLSDTIYAKIEKAPIEYAYLCAERLGPRNIVEYHNSNHCGVHGEYTAYIINKNGETDIDQSKWLDAKLNGNFSAQLDNWLQYLFPQIKVQANCQYNKIAQLSVLRSGYSILPTHIGFGLSYSLPIIVEGLLLPRNSWFIVENPEAHLQPKAQVQIGFFLAKIANSGIRVMIETHSEHILEGIVAYAREQSNATQALKDVSVYILDRNEVAPFEPLINKYDLNLNGIRATDFPKNFFEYTAEMLKSEKQTNIDKIFSTIPL